MTAPAPEIFVQLSLTREAAEALERACHFMRGQLYLAQTGQPHDSSLDVIYENLDGDAELGIRPVDRLAMMAQDNAKLEAIDRKLLARLERAAGIS